MDFHPSKRIKIEIKRGIKRKYSLILSTFNNNFNLLQKRLKFEPYTAYWLDFC